MRSNDDFGKEYSKKKREASFLLSHKPTKLIKDQAVLDQINRMLDFEWEGKIGYSKIDTLRK